MSSRKNIICIVLAAFIAIIGSCNEKRTELIYTPPDFTDGNWVKGIAKTWAPAFFILGPIKGQIRKDFAVGKKVIFADGTIRSIVKVEENGGNLIVFVDGSPLDGNIVGYPKTIEVADTVK